MTCPRLSTTELKARSQERRLQAREARRARTTNAHTLILDTQENIGECSCGRWAMSNRQYRLSPVDLKANHNLHVAMVSQVIVTPTEKVSKAVSYASGYTAHDLTFPKRLEALAEKFYRQALTHPAFVYMSDSEIRRSIENRLWTIAATKPLWWGHGPANKKAVTESQLKALEKARQRKTEIKQEALAPYVPEEEATSLEGTMTHAH